MPSSFHLNTEIHTLLSFPEYITGNSQIALVAPDRYNHMTGSDPPSIQEMNGQITVIPSQTQECLLIYHTRTGENSVTLYKYPVHCNQMSVSETISVFIPLRLPSPNLKYQPNIHTALFNCPYISCTHKAV